MQDASFKCDGFVKSLSDRHPGEPRIKSGAGAGVQNYLKRLDSGFHRKDGKEQSLIFFLYHIIP